MPARLLRFTLVVCPLAALVAPLAHAGDGIRPRTIMTWDDTPCATLVDRSASTTVEIPYGVPMDDTETTADEVEDGRRHQFFATCRDNGRHELLPKWITQADVDAADALGLIPEGGLEAGQILEGNPAWDGCWVRITADDARVPITAAQAAMGVDWDVTDLQAGTWVVQGYVWDPFFNEWKRRPGFVKVHDGDPGALPPSVAVMIPEIQLFKDGVATIDGCVDAVDGAVLDAYWAEEDEDPQWVPFLEGAPVDGTTFALEFDPDDELAGTSVLIRVDAVDPMDRTGTGYAFNRVTILELNDPDGCQEGGGFVGSPGCADSGGDDTEGGTGSGGEPATGGSAGGTGSAGSTGDSSPQDGDGGDDGGGGGCGCTTASHGGLVLGGLGLVALLGVRRRRFIAA